MNILIVDDEYYTRKALSVCISESFTAFGARDFQIYECASAEAVLELSRQTEPDIVFTDIRMKETDGITLCEILGKQFPLVQTVIITGYAEFHYAQKAIENRVFRYLLKPVDENEIRNVVQELLHKHSGAAKSNMIPESQPSEDFVAISNLNLPDMPYILLVFKTEDGNFPLNKKRKDFSKKLRDLSFRTIDLVSLSHYEHLVIFPFSPTQFETESYRLLEDFIKKAVLCGEELYGLPFTVGFSAFHINQKELNTAYMEASEASASLDQTLLKIHNLTSKGTYATDFLDSITKKLFSYYIYNYKIAQAGELILTFWDSLVQQQRITDENCRHFLYEVIYHASDVLKKMQDINIRTFPLDTRALKQFQTIQECKEYFSNFIMKLESQFSMQSDNQMTLVKQLIRYIDEHYSEDLNLYDIAQTNFFVHPNYLSKLLKDLIGVSFSKYLLDVRMKNAQVLLKRGDLSVSVVAQLTGYNSESYFVQVFRRYYGKTPGSYRREV